MYEFRKRADVAYGLPLPAPSAPSPEIDGARFVSAPLPSITQRPLSLRQVLNGLVLLTFRSPTRQQEARIALDALARSELLSVENAAVLEACTGLQVRRPFETLGWNVGNALSVLWAALRLQGIRACFEHALQAGKWTPETLRVFQDILRDGAQAVEARLSTSGMGRPPNVSMRAVLESFIRFLNRPDPQALDALTALQNGALLSGAQKHWLQECLGISVDAWVIDTNRGVGETVSALWKSRRYRQIEERLLWMQAGAHALPADVDLFRDVVVYGAEAVEGRLQHNGSPVLMTSAQARRYIEQLRHEANVHKRITNAVLRESGYIADRWFDRWTTSQKSKREAMRSTYYITLRYGCTWATARSFYSCVKALSEPPGMSRSVRHYERGL
jgi:hypothetical protein